VLDAGRCLYFGPTSEALEYFMGLGFHKPTTRSVPELITTVSDPNFQEALISPGCEATAPRTVGDFVDAFSRSPYAADVQAALAEGVKGAPPPTEPTPDLQRKVNRVALQSSARQFSILLRRSLQLILSQPVTFVVTVLANVVFGLVLGSIFFRVDDTEAGAFSRGGLLFMGMLFLAFGELGSLPTKFDERTVFAKQSGGAGFYSVLPFVLAASITDALTVLVKSVCYSVSIYFLAGLNLGAFGERFAYYIAILFLLSLFVSTYARLLSTMGNKDVAGAIGGVALIVAVLFSGFLVPRSAIPKFLVWIYWASPVQYAFHALLINEFDGLNLTCTAAGLLPLNAAIPDALKVCPVSTGTAYVETNFQARTGGMWLLWDALALVGFFLLTVGLTAYRMGRLKPAAYAYRRPVGSVDPDARSPPRMALDRELSRQSTGTLSGATAVIIGALREKYGLATATVDGKPVTVAVPTEDVADTTSMTSSIFRASASDLAAAGWPAPASVPEKGGHGAVLTWRNLSYTIDAKKEPKQLLNEVVGFAEHGQLLALMGSSGAGKTTLLDVLAQRKTGGDTTGEVLVNGVPLGPLGFAKLSGYVEQADLHVREATVREALEFSAALRGGRDVTAAEQAARVEDAMDKLQLRVVQHQLILSLSPSHLKKLTIGCELVGLGTDAILFLDEPTSGLDARDALSVVAGLRLIAADRVAVVCTIHQPSQELFASFDRLLLLSRGGRMVYMGDLNSAEGEPHAGVAGGKLMGYFEDHGAVPLPHGRSPADHMVRWGGRSCCKGVCMSRTCLHRGSNVISWVCVATGLAIVRALQCVPCRLGSLTDPNLFIHCSFLVVSVLVPHPQLTVIGAGTTGKSAIDWNEVWLQSDERRAVEARIAGTDGKPPLVPPELHGRVPTGGKRAASRRQQLRYLTVRVYRRYWRLPAYNFTRLVTMAFLACLLGLSLLQVANFSKDGNTQEAARLIPGAAFLSLLPGILSTNNAVSPAIATRAAMYRELAAGEYGVWAYYMAAGAAEVPYAVLTTIVFLVPYNALVGLPWSAFPVYLLASVLFYGFAIFMGQAIAAVSPTEEIALTLAPLFNTIMNLLSGFLIRRVDIPVYWIWLFWSNPYSFYNVAVLRNLLPDMTFTCTSAERMTIPLPPDFSTCTAIPDGATFIDVTLQSGDPACDVCPIGSGVEVLDSFTVTDMDKWVGIGALVGFIVLARVMTALALKFTRHGTR